MLKENRKKLNTKGKLIFRSIGFKVALAISTLIIVICSILGITAYKSSSKALYDNISYFLQSRAIDNADMVVKEIEDYVVEIEGVRMSL